MTATGIEPQYAYWGTAVSIGFFYCLNRLTDAYFTAPPPVAVDSNSRWKCKNLVVSWIHAFMCACWVLSNFALYPEFMDDLISHYSLWSYAMVCFSVGYFTFDFLDMLVHKKLIVMWELVAHHVAITSVMIYNLLTCTCIAWNIVALSAEVNSFFLHTRKLMLMHGIQRSNPLWQANKVANLTTFVVFRFGSAALICAGMTLQRERVTTAYFVMLSFCMIVMNLVNPILFWRLLRSDVFGRRGCCADGCTRADPCCSGSLAVASSSSAKPVFAHPSNRVEHVTSDSFGKDSQFVDLSPSRRCVRSALGLCHVNGTAKLDKLG